jgi:hypothetical protein
MSLKVVSANQCENSCSDRKTPPRDHLRFAIQWRFTPQTSCPAAPPSRSVLIRMPAQATHVIGLRRRQCHPTASPRGRITTAPHQLATRRARLTRSLKRWCPTRIGCRALRGLRAMRSPRPIQPREHRRPQRASRMQRRGRAIRPPTRKRTRRARCRPNNPIAPRRAPPIGRGTRARSRRQSHGTRITPRRGRRSRKILRSPFVKVPGDPRRIAKRNMSSRRPIRHRCETCCTGSHQRTPGQPTALARAATCRRCGSGAVLANAIASGRRSTSTHGAYSAPTTTRTVTSWFTA